MRRSLSDMHARRNLMATGRTAEGSEFESRWSRHFHPLHVVQAGSGAQTTVYRIDNGGKAAEA
jgi:hypothetical protein